MAHDAEARNSSAQEPWPWLREGLRSAAFLPPRLSDVAAGPLAIAILSAVVVGTGVLLQRGNMAGPVLFYWQSITSGWLTTVLLLWICWVVARQRAAVPAAARVEHVIEAADGAHDGLHGAGEVAETADRLPAHAGPGTATLFGVLLVQQWVISLPLWLIYLALHRFGLPMAPAVSAWAQWGISFLVIGWVGVASICFLWRHTATIAWLRLMVVIVVVAMGLLDVWAPATQFWYPDESLARAAEPEEAQPRLSQENLEGQSSAVIKALNDVQPQRPGVTDLYVITFAPYAGEEVFRREVTMVSEVMRKRFDADGHVMQLQNHAATLSQVPWATPLNLQRAIQRMAAVMDRDEDILFIHLTSHGAQDGQLSSNFGPIEVDPVTPQQLRTWLDDAGIRYRVISVSACFAGAWVAPLSAPGTLMMTASDADHTSYGCGRKSDLTFFGRAMYDEQLRTQTRSFEAAHAAARLVIDQREKEAGKSDGYSNPQISVGELIRPRLAGLQAQLEQSALAPPGAPPTAAPK